MMDSLKGRGQEILWVIPGVIFWLIGYLAAWVWSHIATGWDLAKEHERKVVRGRP